VYIIEDINDKRSSTNITNANKYLSSKYIKMTTIYRYEVGNPTLSPLDIDFYFDTKSIIMIKYLCLFQLTQSKETQGDKNRHVLSKLHNIDDSDFDRFLDHLKTTQPKVSERINNVKGQVHESRGSSATTSEDDFGNDFDPGMILNLPHLCLLQFLILTHLWTYYANR
jgi:hypothetical protein